MDTTNDYSYCNVVGQTDIGRKRKANEDSGGHFVTVNGLVATVCDGMGGHVGGAVASQLAVKTIHELLDSRYFEDPREAIGMAIEAANEAVLEQTRINPELSGMGSTCVLLIVRNGKVYIGHVGDSRIYLVREKKIIQLTKDHSFVQTLVDMGRISREEAEHHPRKNEITNAIGLRDMTPATVRNDAIEPQAGDCFLLCSDGLSGMVSDNDIEKIVSRQREMSSQARADLLVQTANRNGGTDNITVEMVEFTVAPASVTENKGSFKPWMAVAAACAVAVAAAVVAAVLLWPHKTVQKEILLADVTYSDDRAVLYELKINEKNGTGILEPYGHMIGNPVTDNIETNLACEANYPDYRFRIPAEFADDSLYIVVPGKDTVYLFKAKAIPAAKETVLQGIEFKKKARIAVIDRYPGGMSLLQAGSGKPVTVDGATACTFKPSDDIVQEIHGQKTTVTFSDKFDADELEIEFITDKGTVSFIIPVSVSGRKPDTPVKPVTPPDKHEDDGGTTSGTQGGSRIPEGENTPPVPGQPEDAEPMTPGPEDGSPDAKTAPAEPTEPDPADAIPVSGSDTIVFSIPLGKIPSPVLTITRENISCGNEDSVALEGISDILENITVSDDIFEVTFDSETGITLSAKDAGKMQAGTYEVTFLLVTDNGEQESRTIRLNIQ